MTRSFARSLRQKKPRIARYTRFFFLDLAQNLFAKSGSNFFRVTKLEKMYAFAEEDVKKESVRQTPKPPMIDIQHGVSLAEIKASQVTSPLSFAEITAMFEDEPWEQSLEELLASLN